MKKDGTSVNRRYVLNISDIQKLGGEGEFILGVVFEKERGLLFIETNETYQ